jgi:predicted flap endonuclease-1-like 5' DNA nuclease
MEALAALVGIGVAAAAPFVPGLRPVAKAVVKSGLAVAGATMTVATAIAGEVSDLAAHLRSDQDAPAGADQPAAAETAQADAPAPSMDAASAPDDLTRVAGVGPKIAAMLQEAGITTFAQLAVTPVEELQAVLDQGGARFRITDPSAWPAQAQALRDAPPPTPKPFDNNDLVQIDGIGPKIAQVLKEHGIATVDQLAAASVEDLHAILVQAGSRFRITDPSAWPGQAQALLAAAKP